MIIWSCGLANLPHLFCYIQTYLPLCGLCLVWAFRFFIWSFILFFTWRFILCIFYWMCDHFFFFRGDCGVLANPFLYSLKKYLTSIFRQSIIYCAYFIYVCHTEFLCLSTLARVVWPIICVEFYGILKVKSPSLKSLFLSLYLF